MAGEIYVESEILRNVLSLSLNVAARQDAAKSLVAALGVREALDAILSGCGTKDMAVEAGLP
jgi:hypothetical protein